MGWLRELMHTSLPPIGSFGELARRSLAHPGWPTESRAKQRSLATILSKLDRDQELEWLSDRPAVQQALAEVLGVPSLPLPAQPNVWSPATTTHLRLLDLPYARPLNLREEPLPPGIPWLPQRVEAWRAVWWLAPSGAGRTLTGSWLAARGLARFSQARSWPELMLDAIEPGPLFVELQVPTGEEPAPRERLCVAAPFPPSAPGWTLVRSPPITAVLHDVVAWVRARLPEDSSLSATRAARWLAAAPRTAGALDSLGAALGLLGFADEVGLDQVEPLGLQQLVAAWLKFRAANIQGDARLLKERGAELLVGLVTEALAESELPLDASRTEDEWLALVPRAFAGEVDEAWVKDSLKRAFSELSRREIERVTQQLPPGPFRAVRALRAGGLLRPAALSGQHGLAPRWVASAARQLSLKALFARTAHEWGEALLNPTASALALGELARRLTADAERFTEQLLDLEGATTPAYAAAVEATVRLLGAHPGLLSELGRDLIEALFSEQKGLAWVLPGRAPAPRVDYPEWLIESEPLFSVGAWRLAVSHLERATSPLRQAPWALRNAGNDELDELASFLDEAGDDELIEQALTLLARWPMEASMHPLTLSARAVASFREGSLMPLSSWPKRLPRYALAALSTEERPAFAAALSRMIRETNYPPEGVRWFTVARPAERPAEEPALSLWPLLSGEEGLAWLQCPAQLAPDRAPPWAALSAATWSAAAAHWLTQRTTGSWLSETEWLEHLPAAVALEALGALSTAPPHETASNEAARLWPRQVLERLWRAEPAATALALASLLSFQGAPRAAQRARAKRAGALLQSQPARSELSVLSDVERSLSECAGDDQLLAPLLQYLTLRVKRRAPDWRQAYTLLDQQAARRARAEPSQRR